MFSENLRLSALLDLCSSSRPRTRLGLAPVCVWAPCSLPAHPLLSPPLVWSSQCRTISTVCRAFLRCLSGERDQPQVESGEKRHQGVSVPWDF